MAQAKGQLRGGHSDWEAVTLRKALKPVTWEELTLLVLLAPAPFFFCCPLHRPSLEAFLGCLTKQGAAEVVCSAQAPGQLPSLVLEMVFV